MWIWIVLIFSFLGCAVYFFMEILPELLESRTSRAAAAKVRKAMEPHGELTRLAKNLEISDNVENKIKLAQECVKHGMYEEAIELYNKALTGVYHDDPDIMLELARALFLKEDFVHTKETLSHLIAIHPHFKSQEGHLLFARSLEALQEHDAALEEYTVLASYASGLEAKCRYGLLLKKLGQTEKAEELFKGILSQAQNMPKHYRQAQKQWIEMASQQVA